jgi:hypothetical protein
MKATVLLFMVMTVSLSLVGCDPETCENNDCDASTELCVVYGSDIADEPSTVVCEPLPDTCDEEIACSCLVDQHVAGAGLNFCLEEGSCSFIDGVLSVTCPGG